MSDEYAPDPLLGPKRAKFHVASDPTTDVLRDVLAAMERAYLLYLWPLTNVESIDLPSSATIAGRRFLHRAQVSRSLSGSVRGPLATEIVAAWNREFIEIHHLDRFSLQVPEIKLTGSFEISFDGVGEAVSEIVRAIDPQTRRERKSQLAREEAMHGIALEEAARQNQLSALRAQIDAHKMLVDAGFITQEEATASIRRNLRAQAEAADVLRMLSITPTAQGLSALPEEASD